VTGTRIHALSPVTPVDGWKVALDKSGETVTRNADLAALKSYMGGGGGLTPTSDVKTANYTAVANQLVYTNSTAASFTITLPTAPANGTRVGILDTNSSWVAHPVTVARGGTVDTVLDDTTGLLCDHSSGIIVLEYIAQYGDWRLVSEATDVYVVGGGVAGSSTIHTPEEFGAIGDGTSHPLSASYGTLAAAQADYPAARALSDEKDWAAWRQLVEVSGARFIVAGGKYVCSNPDVNYIIKGQSGQHMLFLPGNEWQCSAWSTPVIAWVEKSNVVVDGINIYTTATYTNYAAMGEPFTIAQFNTIVGPVWTTNQSNRAVGGILAISGTDNIIIRNFSIQHRTPSRSNVIMMGVSLNFHADGRPSDNVWLDNLVLDDCGFGIWGYARHLKITRLRSNRYCVLPLQAYSGGHLIYLSTFIANGSGNSDVVIDDVVDYGLNLGTDSGTFTTNLTANTITYDYGAEADPGNIFNGQLVAFIDGKPPEPLVLERGYFVKNYNAGTKTFELTNHNNEDVPAATIDLITAAGAGCRIIANANMHSLATRYIAGVTLNNFRNFRPHGAVIFHNTTRARFSEITHDSEIYSGTLAGVSAAGGVFDSGVSSPPLREGATIDKYIRLVTGTGVGQKRRIIRHEGASGTTPRAFVVDPPWTTTPAVGTGYEVGLPYLAQNGPVIGVPAYNSYTYDDVTLHDISVKGDIADRYGIQLMSVAGPLGKQVRLHDINLDLDISKRYHNGFVIVGAKEVDFKGRFTTRGSWPGGVESNMMTFEAGTTGRFDITLTEPAAYSRVFANGGVDVDVIFRSTTGRPIPYSFMWAAVAAAQGIRFRSEHIGASFSPIYIDAATAGTTAPTTIGVLDYNGTYEIVGTFHTNVGDYTDVLSVKWLVFFAGWKANVKKVSTDLIAGTGVSAADLTCTGAGVLSATVTGAGFPGYYFACSFSYKLLTTLGNPA
jgi:hypothetical protein